MRLIAPAACRQLAAERSGVAVENVIGLDAGTQTEVGDFHFEAVPAAHPDFEIDAQGRHRYLGYVVRSKALSIYHSGDK